MSDGVEHLREILRRASKEAPEPVVNALLEIYAASRNLSEDRLVLMRVRADGTITTEVFAALNQDPT